jgi:hypothetical protein
VKTKFTNCVKALYGSLKSQGLVHCKYNQGNLVITRKYPVMEIEEHHHTFGKMARNLAVMFRTLLPAYIDDLKNYTALLSRTTNLNEKLPATHYAVYLRMMWKLKHMFPEIDMATITREDILKHEYPVRSIKEAMENELLIKLEEANMLNSRM